jgi:hypothetical protein
MIPVGATGQAADPPSWLTYASLGIASVSACIALVIGTANRRLAKRALDLSERQEARRESRVDVYLSSSTSWRRHSHHDRLLGVHLLVSNPSDRATSIVTAELHVTYTIDGVLTTVKVPPVAAGDELEFLGDLLPTALPIRLEPNDAASGLFIFQIRDDLTRDREIERYEVHVRDVHGVEENRQITIFSEAGG